MRTSKIYIIIHVLCGILFLSTAPLAVATADVIFTFDGTTLDPSLAITHQDLGYTETVGGGVLQLQKDAGVGPSTHIEINSIFQLVGDFTVTVNASISSGASSTGLNVNGQTFWQDVYFVGLNQIWAAGSGGNSGANSVPTSTAALRMQRIGTTLLSQYDVGSGFQTIYSRSGAGYDAPMSFGLFMIQEQSTTASAQSTFDDLTYHAASPVPEPSTLFLFLVGAFFCLWRRSRASRECA